MSFFPEGSNDVVGPDSHHRRPMKIGPFLPDALRDLMDRARHRVMPDRSPADPTWSLTTAQPGDMTSALASLDRIRDDCRRMVTRRASLSAGAAIVPLPLLDVGTDIAILLKLLPRINERFGLTPEQIASLDVESKRLVMMFASSVGSLLVGRLVTREIVVRMLMKMGVRLTAAGVVKYVPLLGQALSASLSFGAMKLLGNRHVDDCYEVARRTLVSRSAAVDITGT